MRKTYRDVEKNLELPGVRPGERTNFEGKAVANSILLAIPDEEFAGLREKLYHVDLPYYTVLHEPRQKLEHAFFLNSGMVSLVFNTNGGESVEVGVDRKRRICADSGGCRIAAQSSSGHHAGQR